MTLGRYCLLVVGVALSALAVAWPLALRGLDVEARWAVVYGGALAVLNAIAAYVLVWWSDRRSTKAFMTALLWGMVGRMALLLLAVVLGVLLLGLPRLPLATGLLSLFVLFLLVEITIVHRRRPPLPEAGR